MPEFDQPLHDEAPAGTAGAGRGRDVRAPDVPDSTLRGLFEHMAEGCAHCQMIVDHGVPSDFVYLAVNDAFEVLTGLRNVVGKRVSEVIPGIREADPELFALYGRVASTRRPERTECYVRALRMWFSLSAYSPAPGQFVSMFEVISDRKCAEEVQRETSLRLELALRSAKAGSWDWDVVTGRIVWSPETFALFGLDPAEGPASFEAWRSALHPEDAAAAEQRIGEALAQHTTLDSDYRVVLPGGAIRWINAVGQGIYDAAGQPVQMVGLVLDVTARRRDEEALRLAQFSVDAAADAIFWITPDARLVDVNTAACRSLGYSREELLQLRVPDVDTQYSTEHWPAVFAELRAKGTLTVESEQRRKDGSVFPVEIVANYVARGSEEFNCAFVRDIADRQRAGAALLESESTLRTIFSTMSEGVALNEIVYDARGVMVDYRVLAVNDAFYAVSGNAPGTVIGRTARDLYGMPEAFITEFWETHRHRRAVQQTEMPSPTDPNLWYLVSTSPFVDGRFVTSFFDITARRQAEQARAELEAQLRQAQKMESVGRLAGGVAHDFNNMLGVILGNVDFALRQAAPEAPIYADLLEIQSAARRSADLTRQLLSFARKETVTPEVLDLNETIAQLLSMLRRLLGEDVEVVWEPETGLWPVRMDPSQLAHVLTNLCVNARQAIADVGRITIGVANRAIDDAFCQSHAEATCGDFVRVSVRDTGHGMDEATLAHIFEPFFTTKDVGEGTGLGLASVYGAVRQNHGFVTVSSAPGQGTTFDLYLPREAAAPRAGRGSGAFAEVQRGHETILLVEDEPAILRLAQRVLEGQGYTVLAAGSPGEALRLAQAHAGDIQLLLSDLVMPEMNGQSLAAALEEQRPSFRRLFMSGYAADVMTQRGVAPEHFAFLQKPYAPSVLLTKVREVLDDVRD